MTALEDFEKKHNLPPLTIEQISNHIEVSEAILAGSDGTESAGRARVICWLHDRLRAVYAALENPKAPVEHKCGWCWRAAGATQETWNALPKMDLDGIDAHVAACEHNPLVRELTGARTEVAALTSELEDLRGRKLGTADAWAAAADESLKMYDHMRGLHESMKATIRALLDTEQPAGELRRALGELVK